MKTHIVTGYYGSGKTEFCVNFAMKLRNEVDGRIYVADMDIINPYFRSREKAEFFKDYDIQIVGNMLDNNTGQDLPAVSYDFLSLIARRESVIIDLAGSEAGLKVLARVYEFISEYELLCVLNLYRPDTCTKELMVDFINRVNLISNLPVTGIVNNSHMLHETTKEHILESQKVILEVCREVNIPLRYTQIKRSVYETCKDEIKSEDVLIFDKLAMRESWQ